MVCEFKPNQEPKKITVKGSAMEECQRLKKKKKMVTPSPMAAAGE